MKKIVRPLKLRAAQTVEFEVWTDNVSRFHEPLKKFDPKKSTKVYYRGYTIEARFKGDVIATKGSDGRLDGIVSGRNPTTISKIR